MPKKFAKKFERGPKKHKEIRFDKASRYVLINSDSNNNNGTVVIV